MDVSKYAGKWFSNTDIPGAQAVVTITGAELGKVGRNTNDQVIVSFAESPKKLGCNSTNLKSIIKLYGPQSDSWPGKQITVFRTKCDSPAGVVPCVRICGPAEVPTAQLCDVTGQPVEAGATQQPVQPQQPPAAPQQPMAPQAANPWTQNNPPQQG